MGKCSLGLPSLNKDFIIIIIIIKLFCDAKIKTAQWEQKLMKWIKFYATFVHM